MPKSPNQKAKLLYLMKILSERTDEAHPMTLAQIVQALDTYGIAAERKSLYSDFETLREFGLDICMVKSRETGYFLGARDFELPELKLLVDSAQAFKFVTEKKTLALIKKLEGLCSQPQANQLRRQVYVYNRAKSGNEGVYYNIDRLHQAILSDRQITFRYFNYTVTKERAFRKNGARYRVSPFALIFSDENYYLLGYDSQAGMMKHYRVDKMEGIEQATEARQGAQAFSQIDLAAYTRHFFSMFGGEEEKVTLEMAGHLAGVVIDRFGKDVFLAPAESGRFRVCVPVAVSGQFFAWVFALGTEAQIVAPEHVRAQMAEYTRRVLGLYEDKDAAANGHTGH